MPACAGVDGTRRRCVSQRRGLQGRVRPLWGQRSGASRKRGGTAVINTDLVAVAPATLTRVATNWVSRNRFWWIAAAILVALPHVPGMNTDFGRSLLSQMGIAAVFALSFNVLFGQTGLLSFGHAVYFGLGGYAAIHFLRAINHGLPIPVPLVPLAGAGAGLLFGILFGSVTTRRAGTIFALITLGIGELVYAATFMLPAYFGGEEGITASRTGGPAVLGITFGSQLQGRYIIAVWGGIAPLRAHVCIR